MRPEQLLVLPFALIRLPLSVADRSIRRSLPDRCRRRTAFDHGLGTLDHWAGLVLDERSIAHHGRVRIAHAGYFRSPYATGPPPAVRATLYARTRPASTGGAAGIESG